MNRRYHWHSLKPISLESFKTLRIQYHQAIQYVALLGRNFLISSDIDENACLKWIPGLWRFAGEWINGKSTFRASICLKDFNIYLVDKKVNTINSLDLAGKNHKIVMLWLEEQIGSLSLTHSELSLELPYESLPDYPLQKGVIFENLDLEISYEFGGYFHNSFLILSEIKREFSKSSEIKIWPDNFAQRIEITIKESGDQAINTVIIPGFSPGDTIHTDPYFFVYSYPHADKAKLGVLPKGSFWHMTDWIGAVLPVNEIWKYKNQGVFIQHFYRSAIKTLSKTLLD